MTQRLTSRIKPAGGVSQLLHLGLMVLLPAVVFVLVRVRFFPLALALILLSKWRMLAVKPRYWLTNIRANAVDIIVGVSFLVFMMHSDTQLWQLVWAAAYSVWLIIIKPGSSVVMVSAQAVIAQTVGLLALFLQVSTDPVLPGLGWSVDSILVFTILGWCICYVSARHFLTSFDEQFSPAYSYTWGYFGAALIWVVSHWLIFYGIVAQPVLLLSILGFGFAALYYLEKTDRLSLFVRRYFIFIMVATLVIIIAFSGWGDKAL